MDHHTSRLKGIISKRYDLLQHNLCPVVEFSQAKYFVNAKKKKKIKNERVFD